ncbi:MAG: hypothetical protein ABSF43_12115 [Rectinemataceae bacterium]
MVITEDQLDEWVRGNSREAQGVIVEFIWRLVAASCPRPKDRRFPLPDSIGQHGTDGVLDTEVGSEPFVPEGRSFWEIGTGLHANEKATSDYNGLVSTIPESTRLQSTFVFVTPLSGRREWEFTWKEKAQGAWIEERRERREWRDVRVIDGTRLIDWIYQYPPVGLWLLNKISGIPPEQVETPEEHWQIIRTIGEPPPLVPKVFLTDRDKACAKMKEVIAGNSVHLKLETHFPDQVVDFVSAYIADLPDESRVDAAGRCLIVSGIEAWEAMIQNKEKLILVADSALDLNGDQGTKLIQKARRSGHSVIFGGPVGGIPDPSSAPLRLPRIYNLQTALEAAGHGEERARTLSQKSGGNLGSLLRCLQNISLMPEWADGSAASELAIAAVLGAWTETSAADRAIVEGLSGNSYGEWIGKIRDVASLPATPLIHRDGAWRFIARYEGWYALGPRLYDEQLDRLYTAAITVLGEKDPQFKLPPDERFAAGLYGKALSHSPILRKGIADTLALLGSYPKALTSCRPGKAEATTTLVIRKLLTDADWQLWASLDSLLPLLAEAAPDEFLGCVERALNRAPCPFDELFAQEGTSLTGSTYISGLLWALETLAWDENYLCRVVICLGELATHDPGGQWANRPANSLTAILLPWLPQTCASVTRRSASVSTLLREIPEVGWKSVISLLPQWQSTSSGTRRPAWRPTIPDDWSRGVTKAEYWQQVEQYSEIAITAAKKNTKRLTEFIDHMENLPKPVHEKLLEYLKSDEIVGLSQIDRLVIWTKLVDLVAKHKRFPDAKWAMNTEQIEKIAAIADQLAPETPSLRHQRLFEDSDFLLYNGSGDYGEQQNELESRRQKAVAEIAAIGGVQSVLEFATTVQSPIRVGMAFGLVAGSELDREVVPVHLESEQKQLREFAFGFILGKFRAEGWPWVDSIDTSQWTQEQVGHFLALLPFTSDTWERAKILLGSDESAYWLKVGPNPYGPGENLVFAVEQLIHYGRPFAAIRCLNAIIFQKQKIDCSQAIRALLAGLSSPEKPDSTDSYQITEVIKYLQNEPDTDPDGLFHVEWAYLPLLDRNNGASPKLLEKRLADDPSFFCEVIRSVFRSNHEEHIVEEPSEKTKRIATNAYRLLSEWRTSPV